MQQKTRSCRFQIQQHISQQGNPDANNKEKIDEVAEKSPQQQLKVTRQ
jgi:hypothetical protein